ncbi:hypothetical protein HY345_04310 [Candidatus Microgenomates bacterium]|nr:hypothetical protein [Candidatus Microgenomates bacterium]
MIVKVNKLPDSAVELIITLEWEEIKKVYEEMLTDVVTNAEIKGFRKGKAPRDVVEKNLNRQSFFEEVLKKVVSDSYSNAIAQENIKPIIYPKVEVISAEENKPWEFKATTSEFPEISLANYKEELAKKNAGEKIWIPGKEEKPKEEDKNTRLNKNLEFIIGNSQFGISELLIEDEVNKLLSELLAEIKKLGLTLDQYLISTGKNAEGLRVDYRDKALKTLQLEFLLSVLAEKEKITVSDEEIEKALEEIKDEKTKEVLTNSKYQLASLLRRQKTLDFIAGL